MSNPIVEILIERDDMSREDAEMMLAAARERIEKGENPEEILLDDFGLEIDYIFDLFD